jgi:hypothetical protein
MPAGFFDAFPRMHKQIIDGLRTATPGELKAARRVCRFLDRVLGKPEIPKRDVDVVAKSGVPGQPVRVVASIWSSSFVGVVVRAATMALIIFGMRAARFAITKAGAALLDRSVYRIFKFAVSGRNSNACR